MNQYGVYGKFRSLQNAAWRCLADCNINTIPIKVISVARYYDIAVQQNSALDLLASPENACCLYKKTGGILFFGMNCRMNHAESSLHMNWGIFYWDMAIRKKGKASYAPTVSFKRKNRKPKPFPCAFCVLPACWRP